jgi:2-desacetyl-2-hydroxyethyl bacteriochlorophyllide A dehydrogenase
MENKMKAAVFESEGNLVLKEVPIPSIEKNDDVLIRIESASICGTDIHILEVPPGFPAPKGIILGHELAGKVEALGPGVKDLKVGDRVVINPNDYDCTCRFCKANLPNQCENLYALGVNVSGGFSKYCKVTSKVCHKINISVHPDEAAFAEPLACVISGVNKIRPKAGESALILGAGPIGLLSLKLLKISGASRLIISQRSKFRRELAGEIGADLTIDPSNENLEDIVLAECDGGVDMVVDAIGNQLDTAVRLAKKNGRILLMGFNDKSQPKIPQSQITLKEIKIMGTWLANATFPEAVKLIESGVLELKKLITYSLPLEDIHRGIELIKKGKAFKVMINP